ncbi:hypothetical protein ACHAQH_006444 [Verticillium albo-atrum]
MEPNEITDQVNKRYGSIVKSRTGHYEQTVAKAFGYTEEELADIPDGANLGLSCGNPFTLAGLREGESVIDLGSGAGFDVFTAAKRVGCAGKAIGVDMNKNMIDKANANKAEISASNVQFIESAITSIPLPNNTADCIISNCVINLVPASEKQLVFNEMFRLLKPGGRVAVSDILARKEFTEAIKKNIALYVGCVAGASRVSEYDAFLKNAGFCDVLIVDSQNDLNVYFATAEDERPVDNMSGGPYTIPYSGSRAKGPEYGYAPDSGAPGSGPGGYRAADSGYKQPVVASDAPAVSTAYYAGHHGKGASFGASHSTNLCHPKYANAGAYGCEIDDNHGKSETVHHVTPKTKVTKDDKKHQTYDGVCDERDMVPDLKPFDKVLGGRLIYPCSNCHLFVLSLKRKPDFCDVCRMIPDCKDCGRDYPEMGGHGVRRPSIGFTFPNGNVATYDTPKPEFPFDLVGNYTFGQSN